MDIANLQDNRLAISMVSLVVGILLNQLITALRSKTNVLGYITYFNRIGLSVDDQIFGSIRLNWEGHELRNLYSYSFEIENLTSQDFENFNFEVITGNETILLNQKTEIVDTPYIVRWSPKFEAEMAVLPGQTATEAQIETYHRRREYQVPVLNRGQRLLLTFLCTRPNDDEDPFLGASTLAKGLRLKRLKNPYVLLKPVFGVPIPTAIARAFVVALLVVGLCSAFIHQPWLASIISMAVGLTAQLLGAALYKIERLLKRAISG